MAVPAFLPTDGTGSPAEGYAAGLLRLLGSAERVADGSDPVADWAESGAMALTGRPDGPPVAVPGPAVAARGALCALAALAPAAALPDVRLLGERAALGGLTRRGRTSCGGATRMVDCRDGAVALALARPGDTDLAGALTGGALPDSLDPWPEVSRWVAHHDGLEVRDRAALLGLACAVPGESGAADTPWVIERSARHRAPPSRPLVVDLSALWAGPLCASLLGMLGCEVVKVEDPSRPDGARRGVPGFFDLLNAGASSVAVDLRSRHGRERLRALLDRADVVIEASRPRALAQLGVSAGDHVARTGVTWVSITGHGRAQPHRIGYGDDAAVAGGLMVDGGFVGDAIGDPLAGTHAALAAWHSLRTGGGRLVDVALSGVAAAAARLGGAPATVWYDGDGWWVGAALGPVRVAEPVARPPRGSGPPLAAL